MLQAVQDTSNASLSQIYKEPLGPSFHRALGPGLEKMSFKLEKGGEAAMEAARERWAKQLRALQYKPKD